MASIGHAIKSRLPGVLRRVFELGQRFGANILPNHFYSDIPDFRHLRNSDYWRKPYSMHTIRGAELAGQLAFAQRMAEPYRDQLEDHAIYEEACRANGEPGFGPIEGAFLYCFVRSEQPGRIVQVGCGVSTALMLRAALDARESGAPTYAPEIVCIEPFPTKYLRRLAQAGDIRLIEKLMQEVPLAEVTGLQAGDLLFVDSSHSLRVGSEVIRIVAEVLPRLADGVWVHFHDIPFPYDYNPGFLGSQIFFSREVALLYAFLACNPRYTIEASLAMLHHGEEAALRDLFPAYRPVATRDGLATGTGHFPSSIYLRVARG